MSPIIARTVLVAGCIAFWLSSAQADPALIQATAFLQNGSENALIWARSCDKKAMTQFADQCKVHVDALYALRLTPENLAEVKAEFEEIAKVQKAFGGALTDAPSYNLCQPEIIKVKGCLTFLGTSIIILRGRIRGFEIQNPAR